MMGLDCFESFSSRSQRVGGTRAMIRMACAAAALFSGGVQAATLTWDGDTSTAGAQDGPGTWETNQWYDGANDLAYSANSDAVFGAASGAAGTVNLTTAETVNTLTFNPSGSGAYTIGNNGTAANILSFSNNTFTAALGAASIVVNQSGTISAQVGGAGGVVKHIAFSTAGQTLTLSGGSPITGGANQFLNDGTLGSATNSGIANPSGSIYGTGATAAAAAAVGAASTVQITAGNFYEGIAIVGIGNIATGTGGLRISGGLLGGATNINAGGFGSESGLIVVEGGTVNTGVGTITVARGQSGVGTGGRIIVNSGTLTSTSDAYIGRGLGANNETARIDVNGGTFTAPNLNLNTQTSGITGAVISANITGGVSTLATTGGVYLNNNSALSQQSSAGSTSLNVSGGTLYVGSGGIVNGGTGAATASVNYSGGTIGALADWSSSVAAAITSGAITFQAADASNVAHNITLSGALSGAGGITKIGGGALVLSSPNTFLGNTTINAGTLTLNGTAPTELSDVATLSLLAGTTLNLNALTGTETVGGLTLAGNSVGAGLYTAAQLSALAPSITFNSGSGETLTVVPEPATLGLLTIGGLTLLRRRVRA